MCNNFKMYVYSRVGCNLLHHLQKDRFIFNSILLCRFLLRYTILIVLHIINLFNNTTFFIKKVHIRFI